MIDPATYRPFGTTGLLVSPIGIGCARIGGMFQRDPKSFVRLIVAAADAGINFFDTADMYSQGESEAILGRALKGMRGRVIVATKVGYVLPTQRRLAARIKPLLRPLIRLLKIKRSSLPAAVRGAPSQEFSPGYIRRAVEGSLRRLRTDYVDVLQLHSPPESVIRRGDWVPALQALQSEGKVRCFGVACDTAEDAMAAMDQPGVAVVQVTVNLLDRKAADVVLPEASRRGIAVIARECLANGLLAKKREDLGPSSFSSPEEAARRMPQIDFYRGLAGDRHVPLETLAMKYALAQPGTSVALVGVRTPEHVRGAIQWATAPEVPSDAFARRP